MTWQRTNNGNRNQFLFKHLYIIVRKIIFIDFSFVVEAHDDCMHAWCVWLPWISRSVCAIKCDCPGYPGQSVQSNVTALDVQVSLSNQMADLSGLSSTWLLVWILSNSFSPSLACDLLDTEPRKYSSWISWYWRNKI